MIVLSNGDRWVLDDSEWEDAGISYKDACTCKLPIMPIQEFIERIAKAAVTDDEYLVPRKWTSEFKGYWDANFDVYEEVFTDAADWTITNKWSTVYVMPWGSVYVIPLADSAGHGVCGPTELKSFEEYTKAALGEVYVEVLSGERDE